MNRAINIQVFRDTMQACESQPALQAAIENSIAAQKVILQDQELPALSEGRRDGRIILSKKRSFEAAAAYAGKKICVLNFASSVNPGGGAAEGSSAQEESLCRCSTLYPCLQSGAAWADFYRPHRRDRNPLHTDDCIHTPDVVVFKSDTDCPAAMPEEKWFRADIITCAAPDLRTLQEYSGKISAEDLSALHERRMERILHIAAMQGCEAVILGAFGCGVFRNDPEIVAAALNRAAQAYRRHFDIIEFAVFCRAGNDINFRSFERYIQP